MLAPRMPRPRAEASISIDAPLELVWQVMLDVDRYPAWNPFVTRVEGLSGAPRAGQSMRLHVAFKDGSRVVSREEISRVEPPSTASDGTRRAALEYAFRGPLHALNLVRGSRLQTLTSTSEGTTLYRSEEEFRGVFTMFLPLANVRDGFERHAKALKTRAEELRRAKG